MPSEGLPAGSSLVPGACLLPSCASFPASYPGVARFSGRPAPLPCPYLRYFPGARVRAFAPDFPISGPVLPVPLFDAPGLLYPGLRPRRAQPRPAGMHRLPPPGPGILTVSLSKDSPCYRIVNAGIFGAIDRISAVCRNGGGVRVKSQLQGHLQWPWSWRGPVRRPSSYRDTGCCCRRRCGRIRRSWCQTP